MRASGSSLQHGLLSATWHSEETPRPEPLELALPARLLSCDEARTSKSPSSHPSSSSPLSALSPLSVDVASRPHLPLGSSPTNSAMPLFALAKLTELSGGTGSAAGSEAACPDGGDRPTRARWAAGKCNRTSPAISAILPEANGLSLPNGSALPMLLGWDEATELSRVEAAIAVVDGDGVA